MQAHRAGFGLGNPFFVGLAGMMLVLFLTFPAAVRTLGGDDLTHVFTYPHLNKDLSLVELVKLNHWQQYGPSERHWRPAAKVMWSVLAPAERTQTRHLWFATGVLAGVCAGLFGAVLNARGFPNWAPWAGLLVFAHPLTADLTLPFVGQSDLLAAAGLLLAVLGFANGGVWRLAGGVGIAISILAKESALPAIGAVPLAVFLAPGSRRSRLRNALWAAGITAAVIAARFAIHGMLTPKDTFSTGEGTFLMRKGERYPGPFETLGRYVWGIVSLQISGYDNCHLKAPGSRAGGYPVLGGVSLLAGTVGLILALRRIKVQRGSTRSFRQRRLIAAGLLWAGAFIAIYLHIIPIGALWQGRFAFLSLLGLTVCLCAWAGTMRNDAAAWIAWLMLAAGVLGGTKSFRRASDFKSPLALARAEVAMSPENAFAKRILALELNRSGKPLEALQPAQQATEARPWDGEAWWTRAIIETKLGRRAEAVASFEKAIPITPYLPSVHVQVAEHLIVLGRLEEAERHVSLLEKNTPSLPSLVPLRKALADARNSPASSRNGD